MVRGTYTWFWWVRVTISNPIREVWAEERTAFGLWLTIPDSFSAEIMAGADVDYVCVDQQHGVVDYTAMVPMLQAVKAAGAAPIARVLSNDPYQVMKSLDAGALGVIVPLVNNAEEAARVVAACRYPPRGIRSYGPIRAAGVIGSKDPEDLTREVLCIVMVETLEGLEKVEEIAGTPGVDGIYIGPADLALSLGLPPTAKIAEEAHVEAVRKIREVCKEHGIAAGIHATSGEWARKHAEAGFDMVTVAADASLLEDAARREVAAARGE
ncbi:MAG: 2,4-dihydroxyhept-2-ene-1,7-dioic acid aldolase (EC [uncultured Rubrobacteraceae bacterium]|uniref:2,4-dihydroxyhept-2-ene-1,7-dioic acid aldolase (EC) n=1 Tax=uncultured Rubrobacteraceae bacterium TaxID=349277 RepID=A0A6J4QKK7_9ACTN|nr:MAG: 2,4-dihydroxyhept-2-ene-1,7-dioic acid aldolase (EC [uncultured Rubrobacteraceae bacterium]